MKALTEKAAHWRGLVERYGGNTTEIVQLEELEKAAGSAAQDKGQVGESFQEQLRLNEELQQGASLSLSLLPSADQPDRA